VNTELLEPPVAEAAPWSASFFEAQLRGKEEGYHIHHPFNRRLNRGELHPFQVRGWVANRFYYQVCIPVKDAAILSNCPDRETRRHWIERVLDHDGCATTKAKRRRHRGLGAPGRGGGSAARHCGRTGVVPVCASPCRPT
jgi:pyrroloquinoline quinone (PQQ) biosynthesis protein C